MIVVELIAFLLESFVVNVVNFIICVILYYAFSSEYWNVIRITMNTNEIRILYSLLTFQCIISFCGIFAAIARSRRRMRDYLYSLAVTVAAGVLFLSQWRGMIEESSSSMRSRLESLALWMVLEGKESIDRKRIICAYWRKMQTDLDCEPPYIAFGYCIGVTSLCSVDTSDHRPCSEALSEYMEKSMRMIQGILLINLFICGWLLRAVWKFLRTNVD